MEDKVKLTKQAINVMVPAESRYYVRDARQPGLSLVVQTSGAKSYYVVKKVRGRVRRVKLGDHPGMSPRDARKAAIAVLDGLNRKAPQTRFRDPETLTLGDLWVRYYRDHVPKLRDGSNLESIWRHHLSSMADRPLSSIRPSDVEALMTEVESKVHAADPTKSGERAANSTRGLLSRMWRKSTLWGLTDYPSPVSTVPRRPRIPRERFLSDDELRRFLAAVRNCENPVVRDVAQLLLFTAARKGNVLAMEWSEISFADRVWTIPAAKFKGGRVHLVPLVDSALEILGERHENRETGVAHVFPARWGWKGYVTNIHTAGWADLLQEAEIEDFTVHDLRSVAATLALNEDESEGPVITEVAVGAWLGHRRKSITGIYARAGLKLARKAAEAAEMAVKRAGVEVDR